MMGEAMHGWGEGVYGESVFSSQFCCEPKTALEKGSLLKKVSQATEILTQWYLNAATWKAFVSC